MQGSSTLGSAACCFANQVSASYEAFPNLAHLCSLAKRIGSGKCGDTFNKGSLGRTLVGFSLFMNCSKSLEGSCFVYRTCASSCLTA